YVSNHGTTHRFEYGKSNADIISFFVLLPNYILCKDVKKSYWMHWFIPLCYIFPHPGAGKCR
ncbi:MAG TPA: hypothetical protein PLC17_11940, partial [Tenuifilaceae bacterium]|nr:hypothetical protein [Tenuifilaceae bacterium]